VRGRAYPCALVIVESIRLRLLLIAPLRLGLSVVWLVAARVAGAASGSALIAFATGAFLIAFFLLNDPRARFVPHADEPEPLPAGAALAPASLHAYHAALPSTVGVSILAGLGLLANPTLTALLAGILAGLGVVALLYIPRVDGGLYVDPRQGRLYRKGVEAVHPPAG